MGDVAKLPTKEPDIEPEFKAVLITNPLYIGKLGPRLQAYAKKLNVPGVTYETIYGFLVETVQRFANIRELWVVYDQQGEPQAFAHFSVAGLPRIGTVNMDEFYSWVKDIVVTEHLLSAWIDFGKRHNCPLYMATTANQAVIRYARTRGAKRGYKIIEDNRTTFTLRKT